MRPALPTAGDSAHATQRRAAELAVPTLVPVAEALIPRTEVVVLRRRLAAVSEPVSLNPPMGRTVIAQHVQLAQEAMGAKRPRDIRSEEHTSELQSPYV